MRRWLMVVASLLVLCLPVRATDFWVDSGQAGDCSASDNACATVQAALDLCDGDPAGPYTIYIKGGEAGGSYTTYTEVVTPGAGVNSQTITLEPWVGYPLVEIAGGTNGAWYQLNRTPTSVTLKNLKITQATDNQPVVYVDGAGSGNLTLDGCTIINSGGTTGVCYGVRIRYGTAARTTTIKDTTITMSGATTGTSTAVQITNVNHASFNVLIRGATTITQQTSTGSGVYISGTMGTLTVGDAADGTHPNIQIGVPGVSKSCYGMSLNGTISTLNLTRGTIQHTGAKIDVSAVFLGSSGVVGTINVGTVTLAGGTGFAFNSSSGSTVEALEVGATATLTGSMGIVNAGTITSLRVASGASVGATTYSLNNSGTITKATIGAATFGGGISNLSSPQGTITNLQCNGTTFAGFVGNINGKGDHWSFTDCTSTVAGTNFSFGSNLSSLYITGLTATGTEAGGAATAVLGIGADYIPTHTSGKAQAGGASTITLAATADTRDGVYLYSRIKIIAGTGIGQVRRCYHGNPATAYNGTTKVSTVDTAWSTNPDNTSVYEILPANAIGYYVVRDCTLVQQDSGAHAAGIGTSQRLVPFPGHWRGKAQAGGAATIQLQAIANATSEMYTGYWCHITGGTGNGQKGEITAYDGATLTATVSPAWTTQPDNTSYYEIIANKNHPTGGGGEIVNCKIIGGNYGLVTKGDNIRILGNRIRCDGAGAALYLASSTNCMVRMNTVLSVNDAYAGALNIGSNGLTAGNPISRGNTIADNIFVAAGTGNTAMLDGSPTLSQNNITDRNIYWNSGGTKVVVVNGVDYATIADVRTAWQALYGTGGDPNAPKQSGYYNDTNSLVADPLFLSTDSASANFLKIKPGSPARGAGSVPYGDIGADQRRERAGSSRGWTW